MLAAWSLAAFAAAAPAAAQSPAATDAPRDAATASPVRTKLAYFAPAQFDDLPGWRDDNFREASAAFRESCSALGKRPAWSGPCGRFASIDARSGDAFRRFLEAEFVLYQIHNRDETPTGVVTGYYEPLLEGSRQRGGAYVFPVYGVPSDLLYLDAREAANSGTSAQFVIRGRTVVRADAASVGSIERVYTLQLSDSVPDVRDRKLRVRIEGSRIVTYPSRTQIDTQGLPQAEVLAWVSDPTALYSMHIQGAGRIRMPDGEIVRLAFAEQNGHPFKPPVAASRVGTRGLGAAVDPGLMTRGIDLQARIDTEPAAAPVAAPEGMRTRGLDAARAAPTASAKARDSSAEVDRMVELLLGGSEPPAKAPRPAAPAEVAKAAPPAPKAAPEQRPTVATAPPVAPAPPPAVAKAAPEVRPPVAIAPMPPPAATASPPPPAPAPPPPIVAAAPATPPRMAFGDDPSYIFFRFAAAREGGPIGALGVPLTPQRSIAVDPRSTPLGMPVYIAAEGASGMPMRRLMLAQDTGGAIRGAVRADYFWGFGAQAGQQASQTKALARMWLLVPRDLALGGTIGTRGLGRRGVVDTDTECLVADPELCVE